MDRLTRWNEQTEQAELKDWYEDEWREFRASLDTVDWLGIYSAIDKLAEYEDLEEQGRLIKLSVNDIHPCRYCDVGWESISIDNNDSCRNYCNRLKEYNEKYCK